MSKDTVDHTDAALLAAAEEFNRAREQIEYLSANPPGTPFGDPRTEEYEAQIDSVNRVSFRAVETMTALPARTRAKAKVARSALMDLAMTPSGLDPEENWPCRSWTT